MLHYPYGYPLCSGGENGLLSVHESILVDFVGKLGGGDRLGYCSLEDCGSRSFGVGNISVVVA